MDRNIISNDYIKLPDIENQWDVYEASRETLLAGERKEGKYALFVNERTFQYKIFDTVWKVYNYVTANTKRGYDECLLREIKVEPHDI